MHSDIAGAWDTLHLHLEAFDVLVLQDELDDSRCISPLLVGVVGQVTL